MIIAQFLDINLPVYIDLAIKSLSSIRKAMPQVKVILLSRAQTCMHFQSSFVNAYNTSLVITMPKEHFFGRTRCLLHAFCHETYPKEDILFMDVDAFLLKDVSHVFDGKPFAIGATYRRKIIVPEEPANYGVCFSRNGAFWIDVAKLHDKDALRTELWCNQVAASGKYVIKKLDGSIYNYDPDSIVIPDEVVIVHYKGNRKRFATKVPFSIRQLHNQK